MSNIGLTEWEVNEIKTEMSTPLTYTRKEPFTFEQFQPVCKPDGDYDFPGIVVARFYNLKGHKRYVVEATGPGYQGILHIFNEGQLRAR